MEDERADDRVQFVQSGRPRFFDDPVNDQLLAMITALLGEISVLRERLDTVERIAEQRGLWRREDVEQFEPEAEAEQARDALRKGALTRVFAVLNEEIARLRHEAGNK